MVALTALDAVLAPVHDIAVAAFQRMVDQFTGFACPTLAQNQALTEHIMLRADRFGLGLYLPTDVGLVRVRFNAYAPSPFARRNMSPEVAEAGKISISGAKDPGQSVSSKEAQARRQVASIPQLIVARSQAEAEAL